MEDRNHQLINEFKELYDQGFKCIYYEKKEETNELNVYLKNFQTEKTKTKQYSKGEGEVILKFIKELK